MNIEIEEKGKMKEHFGISLPRRIFTTTTSQIMISFLLSLAIVYSTIKFNNMMMSIISLLLLTILFTIIIQSFGMTNTGLSTQNTTYPLPPHLGLDGISLENRYSANL